MRVGDNCVSNFLQGRVPGEDWLGIRSQPYCLWRWTDLFSEASAPSWRIRRGDQHGPGSRCILTGAAKRRGSEAFCRNYFISFGVTLYTNTNDAFIELDEFEMFVRAVGLSGGVSWIRNVASTRERTGEARCITCGPFAMWAHQYVFEPEVVFKRYASYHGDE